MSLTIPLPVHLLTFSFHTSRHLPSRVWVPTDTEIVLTNSPSLGAAPLLKAITSTRLPNASTLMCFSRLIPFWCRTTSIPRIPASQASTFRLSRAPRRSCSRPLPTPSEHRALPLATSGSSSPMSPRRRRAAPRTAASSHPRQELPSTLYPTEQCAGGEGTALGMKAGLNRLRPSSKPRSFRCGHGSCASESRTKRDLKRHRDSVHSKLRPYFCEVKGCPRKEGFSRKDNKERHHRDFHERPKKSVGSPQKSPSLRQVLQQTPQLHEESPSTTSRSATNNNAYQSLPLTPPAEVYNVQLFAQHNEQQQQQQQRSTSSTSNTTTSTTSTTSCNSSTTSCSRRSPSWGASCNGRA